jgi:hypothetical protein
MISESQIRYGSRVPCQGRSSAAVSALPGDEDASQNGSDAQVPRVGGADPSSQRIARRCAPCRGLGLRVLRDQSSSVRRDAPRRSARTGWSRC